MNSKQKYLKYKMKYLHLKSLVGGNGDEFLIYPPQTTPPTSFDLNCSESNCILLDSFPGEYFTKLGGMGGAGSGGEVSSYIINREKILASALSDDIKRILTLHSNIAVKEIKIFSPDMDETDLQRLNKIKFELAKEEIQALKLLDNEYVLKYYFCICSKSENKFYIVTEFIEGKELLDFISTLQKADPKKFLLVIQRILIQILLAINYIHSKKVTHGDIKQDNIMVIGDISNIDTISIKVIDFGLYRINKSDTPSIKAPKEEKKDVHIHFNHRMRKDIQSIFVMILQMILYWMFIKKHKPQELNLSRIIIYLRKVTNEDNKELIGIIDDLKSLIPNEEFQNLIAISEYIKTYLTGSGNVNVTNLLLSIPTFNFSKIIESIDKEFKKVTGKNAYLRLS